MTTAAGGILLATDLSHRCDRAFERAVALSRRAGLALRIVHALPGSAERRGWLSGADELPSWYQPPDPEQEARARIYNDLARADPAIDFQIHTSAGPAADVVLEEAGEKVNAEAGAVTTRLIVTGVAESEGWWRRRRSGTLDQLMRRTKVPLLMVRDRVAGDYADLLLTTDFSAASARALQQARQLFPAARLTLFHAYDVPYGVYLDRHAIETQFAAGRAADATAFLAAAGLSAAEVAACRRIIDYGTPDGLLRSYHGEFPHHLTIVGVSDGGALYDALAGSVGRRIIDAMPGDIFFVPASQPPAP